MFSQFFRKRRAIGRLSALSLQTTEHRLTNAAAIETKAFRLKLAEADMAIGNHPKPSKLTCKGYSFFSGLGIAFPSDLFSSRGECSGAAAIHKLRINFHLAEARATRKR
jgi:hypothetical protein